MTFSKILGTGSYLPEKVLTNHDLEKMVDTSHDWIVERTGIHQRHIAADNETSADLAEQASRVAMAEANIGADDLDLIIVATCTPAMFFPSTACVLQRRLGVKTQGIAFDLSAACAGFNYALSVADQYIKSGMVKTALVVGSETMSKILDWSDRSTCVLFGDGAGAVLLGASDSPGILTTHLHADGAYGDCLYSPNPKVLTDQNSVVHMEGREVFKVAVKSLEEAVIEALSESPHKQVDWLIPHQANLRIITAVAKKLKLPMEQVIVTLDKQGNTSAATIPLALDEGIRSGRCKRGDTLLLESFGGGFAWGSALITY